MGDGTAEDAWAALGERFVDEHYGSLRGRVRTHVIHEHLRRHLGPPPQRVVDVGGGAGNQSVPLARAGHEVTIVDPSAAMLERAAERLAREDDVVAARVRLVGASGEDAPEALSGATFDAVLCHGVLMYLADPEPLVDALCELTAPAGVLSIVAKNVEVMAMRHAHEGDWAGAIAGFGWGWHTETVNAAEGSEAAALEVKPRWRGVSHEAAAFVFPLLGLILVVVAHTTAARWAAVVYAVGVTAMYAASACYHRGRWSPSVRRRLRRLDHSMILVGIAATYTPIAVVGLDARSARILLGVVWPLAVAGIVVQMLWLNAPRWLVAGLYVVIGWTALAFLPVLWHQLGVVTFSLIVCGGVVYSIGARVYSARRPDPMPAVFGFHEVFHALVIVAGLIFYVAIARVIITG